MAEHLGSDSNGNGNGVNLPKMGPDEALNRIRAIELMHEASLAKAIGPETRADELVEEARGLLAASVQPLADSGNLHRNQDGSLWLVEKDLDELVGAGPKRFMRRQTAIERLTQRFPETLGGLAVEAAQAHN